MTQGTERLVAGAILAAITTAGGVATRYFEQRSVEAEAAQNFGAERVEHYKSMWQECMGMDLSEFIDDPEVAGR